MDYRRIPFHFNSADPAKRQEELRKRFGGLAANKEKMLIDNTGSLGTKCNESNSASNSPRLQHRVPMSVDWLPEVAKPLSEPQINVDAANKPRVRVIPIEIEGADEMPKRHRTFSGPAGNVKEKSHCNGTSVQKDSANDPTPKPRVCNIPITIEKTTPVKNPKPSPVPGQTKREAVSTSPRASAHHNGCAGSKTLKKEQPTGKKPEAAFEAPLRKISGILEKFKGYHAEVEKFSGCTKDKRYRYLDEMLTRCMLELDGIETMGNETVRLSRKEAVRQVQASIDMLETKVTTQSNVDLVEKPNTGEHKLNEVDPMVTVNEMEANVIALESESIVTVPDSTIVEEAMEQCPVEPCVSLVEISKVEVPDSTSPVTAEADSVSNTKMDIVADISTTEVANSTVEGELSISDQMPDSTLSEHSSTELKS